LSSSEASDQCWNELLLAPVEPWNTGTARNLLMNLDIFGVARQYGQPEGPA